MATSIAQKFGLGAGGGQFNGAQAPKKGPGRLFIPPHTMPSATAVTTVASRYYYIPFIVEQQTTFVGSWTYNSGVGDNGDGVKMAAFSEATAGGPGALAKSFGSVTLTGASALRQFASSWTASPGVYYIGLTTNATVDLYTMNSFNTFSAVGTALPNIAAQTLGIIVGSFGLAGAGGRPTLVGDYVGGTYANFPEATAIAPDTSLANVDVFPIMGLYT